MAATPKALLHAQTLAKMLDEAIHTPASPPPPRPHMLHGYTLGSPMASPIRGPSAPLQGVGQSEAPALKFDIYREQDRYNVKSLIGASSDELPSYGGAFAGKLLTAAMKSPVKQKNS